MFTTRIPPEAASEAYHMRQLQTAITTRLERGDTLDTVERELIAPCGLGEEQQSALWLYAWSHPKRSALSRCQPRRPVLAALGNVAHPDRELPLVKPARRCRVTPGIPHASCTNPELSTDPTEGPGAMQPTYARQTRLAPAPTASSAVLVDAEHVRRAAARSHEMISGSRISASREGRGAAAGCGLDENQSSRRVPDCCIAPAVQKSLHPDPGDTWAALLLPPKPKRAAMVVRTTPFIFSGLDGSLSGCHASGRPAGRGGLLVRPG